MTDEYDKTEIGPLNAFIRQPGEGPFSFDPLSPELGSTQMDDGTSITVRSSTVRDTVDLVVEFGSSMGDDNPNVHIELNDVIAAAMTAADEHGYLHGDDQ